MTVDILGTIQHNNIINREEPNRMKQITNIRKAVCIMTIRARGTSFGNRQECLGFIKQFRPDDLSVTLEKETGNKFDSNAIRIVVHIHPISKKTIIGYVPSGADG